MEKKKESFAYKIPLCHLVNHCLPPARKWLEWNKFHTKKPFYATFREASIFYFKKNPNNVDFVGIMGERDLDILTAEQIKDYIHVVHMEEGKFKQKVITDIVSYFFQFHQIKPTASDTL